jgi:hypothetical protein
MDRKASDSIVTAIGIDIGKNTFHLVGQDERGAIVAPRSTTSIVTFTMGGPTSTFRGFVTQSRGRLLTQKPMPSRPSISFVTRLRSGSRI